MININKIPSNIVEHYKNGEVIIKDGDTECNKMYIITKGSVDVYKNFRQLGEVKVASLNKGDFFGEMSLFLGEARTATVVAAEDVEAVALDNTSVFNFFQTQPEMTYSLVQSLCSRIANTNINMAENSVNYQRNVSVLSKEKEEFKTAANTDALTGVYNRRYFIETAAQMIEAAANLNMNVYVTLMDLDFFKKVNDTYGHQAGDEVLKKAAETVNDTLRSIDLFARYGGEEFIMLITANSKEAALNLVERVRESIQSMNVAFEDFIIKVTASFGIAEATASALEDAIANADACLYTAKELGRNRSVI